MISRLPRLTLPISTSPLISERIAGLVGLRASKSSVTLGRPPVISLALPTARGILMTTSPILTLSPFSAITWAFGMFCYCGRRIYNIDFVSRYLVDRLFQERIVRAAKYHIVRSGLNHRVYIFLYKLFSFRSFSLALLYKFNQSVSYSFNNFYVFFACKFFRSINI